MRDALTSLIFALVFIALMVCGCNELRLRKLTNDDQSRSLAKSSEDPSRTIEKSRQRTKPRRSLSVEGSDKARELSKEDGWNAFSALPLSDHADGHRWRHFELEALVALPPDERPDLVAALESSKANVATNAAICLARTGDGRGRDRLIETVGNRDFRLPMRCAAAEALAELHDPTVVPTLREFVDRYGQFTSPAYLPELHAELLYGLATHVDAGTDERFVAAVKSPAATVRLAALQGWARPGDARLPDRVADLRTDSDHRVRAATITALAVRRHPLALDASRGALTDNRLEVRLAAIAALGQIGGTDAQRALAQLEREPEVIQAAALTALAQLGARDRVWAAAESPSWYVRRAVAAALARWPDAGGVLLARRLLADPSLEVQKEVLATLADWPLERAGPVLLEAMAGGGYLSRKTAAIQLAQRWPPAGEFTADAPADRHAEVLADLRTTWSEEHGVELPGLPVEQAAAHQAAVPLAADRVDRADRLVRRLRSAPRDGSETRAALAELAQFGPDLPAVLERLVDEHSVVLPEAVYREILPKCGLAFEHLDRLTSSDVHERRRAAHDLAALSEREPLNGLALSRLCELGVGESDTLVLESLFQVIAQDGREPAVRLAYAGMGHRAAEVRRVAAHYLDAHPAAEHARVLLPALDDKNQAVLRATIKALGHPGMLADTGALERLLTSSDRQIRLAVAEALVILGAENGPQTLELLARDNDIDTRRQAAQLMGRHPDRRYIGTLIGLLDDTLGVRTAALTSLPTVVGSDVTDRSDSPATSTLEKVERWKKWWQSEAVRGQ